MSKKEELIGKGSYGRVYSATLNHELREKLKLDLTPVAIKRNLVDLPVDFIGNIRELDFLKRINHPNILTILDHGYGNPFNEPLTPVKKKDLNKDDAVFFILEKANFSAENLLYTENSKIKDIKLTKSLEEKYGLTWKHYKEIMYQTIVGIEYLHNLNIIHRDIKALNVLIFMDPPYGPGPKKEWVPLKKRGRKPKSNGEVSESFTENEQEPGPDPNPDPSAPLLTAKICDFGMAKIINNQGNMTTRESVYTSWYRAPEVHFGQEYSFPADIWAAGIFFFELIRKQPFVFECDDSTESIIQNLLIKLPYFVDFKKCKEFSGCMKNIRRKDKSTDVRRDWRDLLHVEPELEVDFNSSEGSMDQFIDLISGMLQFIPSRRLSATEIVGHRFFDSYRKERDLNIPLDLGDLPIKISYIKERKYMINFFNKIYMKRAEYAWYKPEILFHSIDLFDRYLLTLDPEDEPMSKSEVYERLLVCIYIFIKYFGNTTLQFSDIVEEEYNMPDFALEFEKELLKLVDCKVFRSTVFEHPRKLKDREIENLFNFMLTSECNGLTRQEIWARVL